MPCSRTHARCSGRLRGVSEAPPRHFAADYLERVTLSDGTRVVLRLIVPEDKQLLDAGFQGWSAESRYARFLTPKSTLTADELRYLTEIDQEHHFALGALTEETGAGLGIARFIRLPELHETAEAAIAVADDAQGRGLGKLLFLRLCAAAAERGLERFRCEVLGSNTGMAALIKTISPERTIEVGSGVMSIEMALPNVTPTEPPEPIVPDGSMYRMLRAAAENTLGWTSGISRLWRRDD